SRYREFNQSQKLQVKYITWGMIISAVFGSFTNLILPIYGISNYANFGPYFLIIFISSVTIAVIKYKLFNIKIIATQLLVLLIWVFTLVRFLISDSLNEQVINGSMLLLLLTVGLFLIRSVIHEVDQREKIEKLAVDLRKANVKLLDLDRQKSEFVSLATHQLRAPLTAMKGYSSLIIEGEMGPVNNEIKEAVSRIFESSKTLTNVVDDYLNISRIELGTMKYSFEMINLKEMIDSVIGELKPNIEKSGLHFVFNTIPQNPNERFMIRADRDKLKQVIANLIDNSMKYTPSGSIEVILSKDISRRKILFAIKDTGVGIAGEVIPKLFEKFVRANNANKQNIYGTGLGLYVARDIVNAHKGHIWAESDGEGKGSQFYMEMDMEV
ncbi:MAG: HAMP domain-containing sensor histidine kinase, partial [Patescibacteria group bacterium]